MPPGCPVFQLFSMSNASRPRTSPTIMRSGRRRSVDRTRSAIVTAPAPVGPTERVRSATTSLAAHCNSRVRSEEHTSELQSLMRISYAVFCLKKKNTTQQHCTPSAYTKYEIMQHKQQYPEE